MTVPWVHGQNLYKAIVYSAGMIWEYYVATWKLNWYPGVFIWRLISVYIAVLILDSHQHLVAHTLTPAQTSQWTISGLWQWTVSHHSQTGSFIFALVPFMTGLTLEISITHLVLFLSVCTMPWLYDLVWPPPTLRYRCHANVSCFTESLKAIQEKHTDTLAWKIACMHTSTPCTHTHTHTHTHTFHWYKEVSHWSVHHTHPLDMHSALVHNVEILTHYWW